MLAGCGFDTTTIKPEPLPIRHCTLWDEKARREASVIVEAATY
jgi:hypothetical protein